jgi:hypothetical protein
MSIQTKIAALVFGALATFAMASLGGSEAQAQQSSSQGGCSGHCVQQHASSPHVPPKYCRWAATGIRGDRTPILQRVCVY